MKREYKDLEDGLVEYLKKEGMKPQGIKSALNSEAMSEEELKNYFKGKSKARIQKVMDNLQQFQQLELYYKNNIVVGTVEPTQEIPIYQENNNKKSGALIFEEEYKENTLLPQEHYKENLNYLMQNMDKLKNLIEGTNPTEEVQEKNILNIPEELLNKKDITNTSVRISKSVLNEFKKTFKNKSLYSMSHLMTMALYEMIEKYKER